MKKFYILSAYLIDSCNSKSLFIAQPYVYHKLEIGGYLNGIDSVEICHYTRETKEDLILDSQYVDKKYELYLPLLAERFNNIHQKQFPKEFWQKYMSLGFVRYLTAFYETYKILETSFECQKFDYKALHPDDYLLPFDFEENRQLFLNSDFGQEQIFSIYLAEKHPGKTERFRASFNTSTTVNKSQNRLISLFDKLKRLKWRHLYKLAQFIVSMLRFKQDKSEVVMGVLGSFFSDRNYAKLQNSSRNKIRNLQIPVIPKSSHRINEEARTFISSGEQWFDDFDRFFFSSMSTCLPRICIEEFSYIERSYEEFLDQFPQMKYIVSEAWLSDSYINIFLAYAQNRGIKHIYNEHNCIFHPFVGDYVKHVSQLCDIYATLGWNEPGYPNTIPTASLYEYVEKGHFKKKYKILYIGVPFIVKMQHYSSAWGASGENVPRNIQFLKEFFTNLGPETLGEISYRPYPLQNIKHILIYEKEIILRHLFSGFKEITDTRESSKHQMKKAKLVIIDYISTSYLECLIMNIPFILFWDKNSYYLKEEHADFFTPLVDAGICHTNAIDAAQFVLQIKDDPAAWWFSPAVQEGRKMFMERNIGNPKIMVDFLMSFVKNKKTNNY